MEERSLEMCAKTFSHYYVEARALSLQKSTEALRQKGWQVMQDTLSKRLPKGAAIPVTKIPSTLQGTPPPQLSKPSQTRSNRKPECQQKPRCEDHACLCLVLPDVPRGVGCKNLQCRMKTGGLSLPERAARGLESRKHLSILFFSIAIRAFATFIILPRIPNVALSPRLRLEMFQQVPGRKTWAARAQCPVT